ncbi:MAG: hypothetical protein OEW06_08085 [Gemmatimonadota bacterium]|nr:hypothetical protein [Gemmatimonadota bacterium]
MRRAALGVTGCLLLAGSLVAQDRPRLDVDLRTSGTDPPQAAVRMRLLLADGEFVSAVRSGFPLYVALTVELREQRSLWDRSVERWVWEYVVIHDPVRDVYLLEDADGTEEIPDRSTLERKLESVYVVGLTPPSAGRYHYRASVRARTLSDEDVDEVYAWLRGNGAEAKRDRPGFLARAARKVIVQVAPLPRVDLGARTEEFVIR